MLKWKDDSAHRDASVPLRRFAPEYTKLVGKLSTFRSNQQCWRYRRNGRE